jgi:hypothetical protein
MVLQNIYATDTAAISLPTVVAFLLLLFGSKLLADTSKGLHHQQQQQQRGVVGSARGPLLGYAPDGLPLYHLNTHVGTASIVAKARAALKSVLETSDSRQIFYFLCLNFSFMLTEFAYG